jgi:hypothetical protein
MQLVLLGNDDGGKSFLEKVTHKTEGPYKLDGRPRDCTKTSQISIASMLMFSSLIDRQLQEFRDRFDEVNPELRHFMWSSSSANSFSAYHMLNLVKLAQLYPMDFS